ncbi:MAG: c-type cytochrome [Anaerolineae bacterium]|nr:c-type cytochrome [Anaerolineae bacterium]
MRQKCRLNVQRLTLNVSFLLILSGLIIYTSPSRLFAAPPAQAPDVPPSVSDGRALWAENCQPCHGPAGQGDGPASANIPDPLPNMTDPENAWQYVPTENFDVIKNGRIEKLMPPWGNQLSDAQIWDLTAYIWSLSLKPEEIAAGETIFSQQCAACHGSSGAGDGPEASAPMVSFTDLAAMSQRSQAKLQANFQASEAHTSLNSLSDQELRQVLSYVRTFSFKLPQRNGVLKGQVINASTGQPLGNLEVTLRIIENNVEVERLTTQVDSAGNYTFEKLPTDHSILYVVEGRYKDITYFSNQPGLFTPNSSETTLDLKVYETTPSAEAVSVSQFHYLMTFKPEAINVVQVFMLSNSGNKTYVGTEGRTMPFALPANAQNVTFEDDPTGQRFIKTDSGYTDTEPVTPGENTSSIVAVYNLPYEDTLTINVPLPADVVSANVLMQAQGAKLSSEQLEFVETGEFQGTSFSVFSAADLKKGQPLTLQLTDLDKLTFPAEASAPGAVAPAGSVDQNLLRWIVIGLGAAVIVFVAVGYPYLRPPSVDQESTTEDADLRRQKLLLMLARLDEVFEAGELDRQVYHRARAKYKAELAQLMEG